MNQIEGIRISLNSNFSSIEENQFCNNSTQGIYLESSNNCSIIKNELSNNSGEGIKLWGANYNKISGNQAFD